MKKILLLVSVISICVACAPDEGKGGLASIEGVVMTQNINSLQEKSGEMYPATDADVYISYGESGLADDKGRTGFNGKYKFSNLTKGDYTIFVYSDDTLSNTKYPKITFSQKISLDKKKTEAVADTMIVYKHVDYDGGGGSVKGNVTETYYIGSKAQYTIPAPDATVYLQFANEDEILDRYRTDGKGDFVIGNLIPGKYRLFVLSENQLPADGDSACYRSFEIVSNTSSVVLDTIKTKNY